MKKILCLFFVMAVTFTACQKELDDLDVPPDSGNNNGNDTVSSSITGTYDFISIDAKTQSNAEYNVAGVNESLISAFDYITTNNAGTVVIDDSVMTVSGLTYTAEGYLKSYTYEDNVLIDSTETLLSFTLPLTNSSGKYKLIGADSIYFPEGGFVSISGPAAQSQPSGGKISISGNTLKLSQYINQDTTEITAGIPYHIIQTGTAIITMEKK